MSNFFLENDIQKNNIENIAKNYAKEFSYTNNHISNYISDEYSMIIYKNSDCIKKLKIDIPTIDFKECYEKVVDYYSIKENLIIAVIDRYIYDDNSGSKNPDTSYAFFHPKTGENLNANEICKEVKIIIEENILSILEDNKTVLFFSSQNVNIFNISNQFYTDICFNFESPNNKDVVLKDRIKSYYPNITLCDSGCKNKGVNLTSLTAICECSFKDLLNNDFLNNNLFVDNIIISGIIKQVKDTFNIINLEVMSCYKTIFDSNYMKKCYGGLMIIVLLVLEIICVILYKMVGIKETIGFLFRMSIAFKDFKQTKLNNKLTINLTKRTVKDPPKKDKLILNNKNVDSLQTNQSNQTKKSNQISQSTQLIKSNKTKRKKRGRKTMKNVNININMTKLNFSNNIDSKNKSNSIMLLNSNFRDRNGTKRFSKIPSILLRGKRKAKSSKIVSFSKRKESDKNHFLSSFSVFEIIFFAVKDSRELDLKFFDFLLSKCQQ